jgi:hypothetical protein
LRSLIWDLHLLIKRDRCADDSGREVGGVRQVDDPVGQRAVDTMTFRIRSL